MKFALSYFYHIRFFKRYMIPISTAAWDPFWFHPEDNINGVFKDKNGIYNGLRFEELAPGKECNKLCHGKENCEGTGKNPSNCLFLKKYKEQLEKLDFTKLYTKCDILSSNIKRIERFEEEPIIVFIVYESYKNECSERGTILSVLNNHNIPIEELKYPIKENYL